MLYSVILRLHALREAVIPVTQGYQAYATVLRLLQGSSPALTASLHDDAAAKPFTVSPLQGGQRQGIGGLHLAEGDPCWVRITCLQDGPFCALLDAVLRLTQGAALDLAGCPLALEGLDTVPGANPLIACASFEALLEGATSQRELSLAFLSPTAFRSGGRRNVLFPEPRLLFNSYLARWQGYSPIKLDDGLTALVEKGTRISQYKLETRILHFGTYQEIGFEGRCSIEIAEEVSEDTVRCLNALADFAFYSGTGAKTTMGLGQTRRLSGARSVSGGAGRYPAQG